MMSVLLVLLAALANATASVLQRRADRDEPEGEGAAAGMAMLWHLAHNPVWIAGIAAIVVGFGLQAAALATAPIALVQPILVLELPLTLILAGLVFRSRLHAREWTAVAGMSLGLAVLLAVLQPSGGNRGSAPTLTWVIGSVVTLGTCGLLVLAGYRARHNRRAALLGLATGIGFGFTAVLVAAAAASSDGGVAGVLTTWQTYLLVVVGPGLFFLLQKTMQAGRLVASQPALTLANPIVSVVFGLVVFDERVRTGWWLAAAFAGAALIVIATVALVRSPLLADDAVGSEYSEGEYSDGAATEPA